MNHLHRKSRHRNRPGIDIEYDRGNEFNEEDTFAYLRRVLKQQVENSNQWVKSHKSQGVGGKHQYKAEEVPRLSTNEERMYGLSQRSSEIAAQNALYNYDMLDQIAAHEGRSTMPKAMYDIVSKFSKEKADLEQQQQEQVDPNDLASVNMQALKNAKGSLEHAAQKAKNELYLKFEQEIETALPEIDYAAKSRLKRYFNNIIQEDYLRLRSQDIPKHVLNAYIQDGGWCELPDKERMELIDQLIETTGSLANEDFNIKADAVAWMLDDVNRNLEMGKLPHPPGLSKKTNI